MSLGLYHCKVARPQNNTTPAMYTTLCPGSMTTQPPSPLVIEVDSPQSAPPIIDLLSPESNFTFTDEDIENIIMDIFNEREPIDIIDTEELMSDNVTPAPPSQSAPSAASSFPPVIAPTSSAPPGQSAPSAASPFPPVIVPTSSAGQSEPSAASSFPPVIVPTSSAGQSLPFAASPFPPVIASTSASAHLLADNVITLSPPSPQHQSEVVRVDVGDMSETSETEIFFSDSEDEEEEQTDGQIDTERGVDLVASIEPKEYSAFLSTEMGTIFRSDEVMQPMALPREVTHLELVSRYLNSLDMTYLYNDGQFTILTGGPFPSVNAERYERYEIILAEVPIPLAWLLGLDRKVVVGSADQLRNQIKQRVGLLRQALSEYFECQRGRETDDQLTDTFLSLIKISPATFLG